jgi:hypothetical protein
MMLIILCVLKVAQGRIHKLFTSGPVAVLWSASHSGRFISRERAQYLLDDSLGEPQSHSRPGSENNNS